MCAYLRVCLSVCAYVLVFKRCSFACTREHVHLSLCVVTPCPTPHERPLTSDLSQCCSVARSRVPDCRLLALLPSSSSPFLNVSRTVSGQSTAGLWTLHLRSGIRKRVEELDFSSVMIRQSS